MKWNLKKKLIIEQKNNKINKKANKLK